MILQILNSDFGSKNTMGYRAYQVYKYSNMQIKVFCRANLSKEVNKDIKIPFIFFREYSRALQALAKIFGYNKFYIFLKKIEHKMFIYRVKKYIKKAKLIHFFYHSTELINYAKKLDKVVILESFTHPLYIKKMFEEGIKLDTNNWDTDIESIKCYELADYIISPSNWVTKTLLFAKIKKDKIIQIEYGVEKCKEKCYYKNKKLSIVFAGGLKRTKGILELLEATNYFNENEIEVHLYGRKYNSIFKDMQSLINNKTNIIFHGFVKNMMEEYQKYDVYVYPTYFEGSSKTVFEAMSCGLPVITTENAGSIVRDGVDGFIVPVNDVKSLVDKIRYFYNNRDEIEKMGKEARKYSQKFTWKRYAKRVNELYEKVLKNED